jgi:prepilin-type N-terminal cleavage/methylation domain-containing protein
MRQKLLALVLPCWHVGIKPGQNLMNRREGFTFVELLMVMLLIGALSSMAVPRFRQFKARAYIATMQSDLGNLKIAQEVYWAEHQKYATDTTSLEIRISTNVAIAITSQDAIGGYTAVATHSNVPGQQCQTAIGRDASSRESGAVACGAAVSGGSGGANTLPSSP